MFDFLHVPELTDNYFQSLWFVFLIVLSFFSADAWLLVKSPNTHRENIKLVDFFISRLRIMIPIFFLTFLITFSIMTTFIGGFFYAALFTAVSFYMSIGLFKFTREKSPLVFWLFACLGMSIATIIREQYSILIGVIAYGCLIPYWLILVFVLKRFGLWDKK